MFASCFPWRSQRGGAVVEQDGKRGCRRPRTSPRGEATVSTSSAGRWSSGRTRWFITRPIIHSPIQVPAAIRSRRDALLDQVVGQGRVRRPGDRGHGIDPRIDSCAMSHDWGSGGSLQFHARLSVCQWPRSLNCPPGGPIFQRPNRNRETPVYPRGSVVPQPAKGRSTKLSENPVVRVAAYYVLLAAGTAIAWRVFPGLRTVFSAERLDALSQGRNVSDRPAVRISERRERARCLLLSRSPSRPRSA